MPRRIQQGAVVLLVGILVVVLAAAIAGPVLAHPYGPPPSALIAVRGSTVLIDWRATPDDAVAVGVHLGFFDEEVLDAYLEAPAQAAPPAADEDALTASPLLLTYLAEHVAVIQDGQRCEVTVVPPENFVHQGARVLHACPEPVDVVEVELTMLHDIHEAYRTFGLAEDEAAAPSQVVFTVSDPRHTIDFGGGGTREDGRSAVPAGPVVGAAVLLVVVGTAAALRLRGRVRA